MQRPRAVQSTIIAAYSRFYMFSRIVYIPQAAFSTIDATLTRFSLTRHTIGLFSYRSAISPSVASVDRSTHTNILKPFVVGWTVCTAVHPTPQRGSNPPRGAVCRTVCTAVHPTPQRGSNPPRGVYPVQKIDRLLAVYLLNNVICRRCRCRCRLACVRAACSRARSLLRGCYS